MWYRLFTFVVAMILASAAIGLCALAIAQPDFLSDYFRDTLLIPDWSVDD